MVLAFLLVVIVDGVTHDSGGEIFFNSIVTCSEYAKWIEETGTTWQTKGFQKQSQIHAHCLPKLVNPKKVKIWR
jgi:hypothetical protein